MKDFMCPVKGQVRLTSPFGWRNIGAGREWHQGVDLASTGKVPIYASADGTVRIARDMSSYGNVVIIQHSIKGKRMDTTYAHLDSIKVRVGQKIKQGDVIGIMGMTGRSYGLHLHFEIHNGEWTTGQPNAINPMKYISLDDWTKKEDKGELTMSQYNELKKMIETQDAEIKKLKAELSTKQILTKERTVGASHKDGWEWLTKEKISNGSNPQADMTREQFGSMLKKFYDKFVNK